MFGIVETKPNQTQTEGVITSNLIRVQLKAYRDGQDTLHIRAAFNLKQNLFPNMSNIENDLVEWE